MASGASRKELAATQVYSPSCLKADILIPFLLSEYLWLGKRESEGDVVQ